jgi:hypothetical protein
MSQMQHGVQVKILYAVLIFVMFYLPYFLGSNDVKLLEEGE